MATNLTPQNWSNYCTLAAREELRAAFAALALDAAGKYKFTAGDDGLGEWVVGNEPLTDDLPVDSFEFFRHIQDGLLRNAVPMVSAAVQPGMNKWLYYMNWPKVCRLAGLWDASGGFGLRYSPGEVQDLLSPTSAAALPAHDRREPMVYFPHDPAEQSLGVLRPDVYTIHLDGARTVRREHLSGPWLTQDLAALLTLLLRIQDEGLPAVLADLDTGLIDVVTTVEYTTFYDVEGIGTWMQVTIGETLDNVQVPVQKWRLTDKISNVLTGLVTEYITAGQTLITYATLVGESSGERVTSVLIPGSQHMTDVVYITESEEYVWVDPSISDSGYWSIVDGGMITTHTNILTVSPPRHSMANTAVVVPIYRTTQGLFLTDVPVELTTFVEEQVVVQGSTDYISYTMTETLIPILSEVLTWPPEHVHHTTSDRVTTAALYYEGTLDPLSVITNEPWDSDHPVSYSTLTFT